MRATGSARAISFSLLCLSALGCIHDPPRVEPEPSARQGAAPPPLPGAGELVVHEWGTFTSLAGSEGTSLDGLHHASEPLPSFVHASGPAARTSPFHAYGDASSYVPANHVNGKMETPVLYFYAAAPQRVQVHVDFVGGLLSEWYPAGALSTPSPGELARDASDVVDVARIERSSLDWDLELTPFGDGPPAGVPAVARDDPWQLAREVRAGFVRPAVPGGGAGGEAEHYVFYRGLGRLSLPVALRYCRGELKARNGAGDPIAAAFALEMSAERGRFEALGRLEAGEQKLVTFQVEAAPKERVVEALGRAVTRALVAEGLYEDEARAMVRTWAPTWFADEGTRVLYILPRATTDAILPIRITPTPTELVRVLVGRQDILTPAAEADVERALEDRASGDPARRDAALRRLARLGRFLEPAVRRAVAWTSSDVARRSGQELLAQFQ